MNTTLRIVLTMLVLIVVAAAWGVYNNYYPPIAGTMAVLQLEDDNYSYQVAKTAALVYQWLQIFTWVMIALCIALWFKHIRNWVRNNSRTSAVLVLFFLALTTAGCRRPYKEMILVEIEPNQTAFVVPLTGQTSDQGQFASAEYLAERQVATKRVEIEPVWHQTGHFNWQGTWIPSARVIVVDRTPVTREWTEMAETGTSTKDDAFAMETRESIDFSYGGNVSALVTEQDAAIFLYRYSGKTLEAIMDSDIRGYMQGRLATEFGTLMILEAQAGKGEIFDKICDETIAKFAEYGISITSCGASGGLSFHDPKIQDAITANFEREQEQVRAQAALEAQEIENQRILTEAEAKAEALRIAGQAEADVIELIGTVVGENPDIVRYEIAKRSRGDVPDQLYFAGDADQLPFPFFLVNPEVQETENPE